MSLPTLIGRVLDNGNHSQREFDAVLNRVFGNRLAQDDLFLAPYGVDVREDADHIYVEAELPGFKKDEVDINLENQTLTVAAERKADDGRKNDKGEWLLRERRYSRFQRSFTLPATVDPQSVQARLDNGMLTVTINKREESKPRRITVS